jgi:glyoxylase-like metal-dependent hydrolase (beta-lactamase superfamily II)
MNQRLATLETPLPGLHASAPHPLPFDPSIVVRAFLLERGDGNLLVYSAPTVAGDAPAIEELGGVFRQYLNHWHEAAFGGAGELGAPLYCHEAERERVAETAEVAGTFPGPARLADDFELVPIPGHTAGATAFLWDSGDHRVLFTGDSVYLRDGEWVAAMLEGSSEREPYIESVERLHNLDFDVLVPWAAGRGAPYHALTDRADARRRLGAIAARLERGENH